MVRSKTRLRLESSPEEEAQEILPNKVLHRRAKVGPYLQMGVPMEAISKELNVHYNTIKRDKKWLIAKGMEWGNEQARGAFLADCMIGLQTIQQTINDLHRSYMRIKKNTPRKRAIGRELREAIKTKMEIADNVPMYHVYSKIAEKHGSQIPVQA